MSNFPLRIDPELKKQLQVLAKEKKRSLNNLIEVRIRTSKLFYFVINFAAVPAALTKVLPVFKRLDHKFPEFVALYALLL